jgi:hypothetical protein
VGESCWLSFSGVALFLIMQYIFCLIFCLLYVSDLPDLDVAFSKKTKTMLSHEKQAEEAIVSNYSETDQHEGKEEEKEENHSIFSVKSVLWHGGSAWDAWFSCASNQVLYPSKPIFKKLHIFWFNDFSLQKRRSN